jgi:hypothetical protein
VVIDLSIFGAKIFKKLVQGEKQAFASGSARKHLFFIVISYSFTPPCSFGGPAARGAQRP